MDTADPRRALVAEDDPEMRALVARVLRLEGFDVVEVGDGVDLAIAIESTCWGGGARPFDVVVSDINMPGLTGLETVAALNNTLSGTPVILMSAFGSAAKRAEARELGVCAVLDKPFTAEALLAAVASAPVR